MEHLVTFDQEQQALLNRAFEMLSVVLESAGTDTITLTRDVDVVGSRCPQKVVLHVLRGQPAEEVMLYVGGVTRGQH